MKCLSLILVICLSLINYVFHNMVSKIASIRYQRNCGKSFWDLRSSRFEFGLDFPFFFSSIVMSMNA